MSRVFVAVSFCVLVLSGCTIHPDPGCAADAQCREGRICVDHACVWLDGAAPNNGGQNNGDQNNGGQNNGDQNNGDQNNDPTNNDPTNNDPTNNDPTNNDPTNNDPTNNDPTNNGVNNPTDEDLALCTKFCDLLFGSCVQQHCMVPDDLARELERLVDVCLWEGFNGDPGCVDALRSEPGARQEVEELLGTLTCESPELVDFRCQELGLGDACGCSSGGDRGVGEMCASGAECGNPFGLPTLCVDDQNEPAFPGGYCVALGCQVGPQGRAAYDDACGPGNICVPIGQDQGNTVCFDGCFSHGECRPEYQCRLVGFEGGGFGSSPRPLRVCLPECGPDFQCGDNEQCNAGRCEFRCDEMSGGGPSGRQRCNALGFTCVADPSGQQWCVMP